MRDLPRFDDPNDPNGAKRALIGDKRNDENVIVSQLHAALLQFHNKLVDDPANQTASFEDVQQHVRWHYQWLVVNDFLVTICGADVVNDILPAPGRKEPADLEEPADGSSSIGGAPIRSCRSSSRRRPTASVTRWSGRSTA